MADLDNFFAMKDKKKKKGKEKKFAKTTSSSMAKTLETTETQPEKEVKIDAPVGISAQSQSQEDEWREQEEETQDLEGLKVQALRLDGEEGPLQRTDTNEPASNPDEDEEADVGDDKSGTISAWQKMSSAPIVTESPEPVTAAIETKTSGGVYIPPSRRQGGGGPTGARRPPHNIPPDIQNASAFPSLQASLQSQPTGKDKAIDKDFKEVKSSKSSRSADSQYEAPSLELTNKYSALRSN